MFASKRVQKYSGILRQLAKLDSSIFNKLKVTVCEGEFIEENKFFLIAPLTQFDSVKDFENKNLSKEITEKAIINVYKIFDFLVTIILIIDFIL